MVLTLTERAAPPLQDELDVFEASFEYPLDAERNFRISHAPEYLRFFQAMGEASCFLARGRSGLEGVLTTVPRVLQLPGERPRSALYVCDLKTAPGPQRVGILLRLVAAARSFHSADGQAAFSVVMRGTTRTPDAYSGGFGVPRFEALAEVAILRIPTETGCEGDAEVVTLATFKAGFAELATGLVHTSVGPRSRGGRYPPVALFSTDGRACGILEDTLDSKRLISGGEELLSAHLSSFAYETPAAGYRVVSSALARCRAQGIPALFVALPQSKLENWLACNPYPGMTITAATVFGHGLPAGLPWTINTSEV